MQLPVALLVFVGGGGKGLGEQVGCSWGLGNARGTFSSAQGLLMAPCC